MDTLIVAVSDEVLDAHCAFFDVKPAEVFVDGWPKDADVGYFIAPPVKGGFEAWKANLGKVQINNRALTDINTVTFLYSDNGKPPFQVIDSKEQ